MHKKVLLGIFFTFLSITPSYAQFENASLSPDISIVANPENPRPGDSVFLEVVSFSVDLNQATIIWKFNDKTIASGIGKTKISITAPSSNANGLISATVTGSGFQTTQALYTLRSASVDLLWEAVDAYTPPFYKGKALLSRNGLIRVSAIQTRSAPKNLSFEWTRNDVAVPAYSGYNKNALVFKNETLKGEERVSVSANGGLFSGSKSITLTPGKPKIVGYQKRDGFIDYANGFTNTFQTTDPGITFRFEPYFFSIPRGDLSKDLSFDIKNGGVTVFGDTKPNEISLSNPGNRQESTITVSINTVLYSLQNALQAFSISFN